MSQTRKPAANPDLPSEETQHPGSGTAPDGHGDQTKGAPTSDRHAAETLAGRLEQRRPAEHKSE